ncbi:MAG: hypothetical protein KDD51_04765 [Bdellovibrionales bacterium]|nr:hypothetical protein [Bdellovibrionales bacterium]
MGLLSKIMLSPKTERVVFVLALLGLFVMVAGLLFYRPEGQSAKGEAIGTIESSGTVRRRHARSLLWENLPAEDSIYTLDYVYVLPGNSARVTLVNGSSLELPAGTMVQFDSLDGKTFEIDLIAGKLKNAAGFSLKAKDEFFVRWKNTRLLDYLPSLEHEALKQQEFLSRLDEYLNKAARKSEFKEPNFQPFTLTQLDQFEIDLIRPRNKQVVKSGRGEWVDAVWSPIPLADIRYEVQVSQREKFDFYVSYQTNYNAISLQIQDSGSYYWRVIAKQGKTGELLSKPAAFVYEVTSRRLSPLLGRIPAATGSKYVTEISTTESFQKILVRTNTNSKRCATAGLKPGEYYCRVRRGSNDSVLNIYSFKVSP